MEKLPIKLILILNFLISSLTDKIDLKSPLNQHLPDCTNFVPIVKKTTRKAGVCTLIKDEQGFLTEFVAYYIVQGIDHLIIYDDNSTDFGLQELSIWEASGHVTVKRAGTWDGYRGARAETWGQQMAQKKMMERDCKLSLFNMGYDYHISVDLDEYALPFESNTTLVDAIDKMFKKYPTRGTFNVNKLQFNSQPHILESIDKLTIEAYQVRFGSINKFSPRKSLMRKSIYWLSNPRYSNDTLKLVLECCTFHSCKQGPMPFCWDLQKTEISKIFHSPWPESSFIINHYARSLEKFTLKQKTWKQHVNAGYDISKYFERSHGWHFDNSAVKYSCQTRYVIKNMTKQPFFIRAGNWIRKYELDKNPQFYKPIVNTSYNLYFYQ
jgi:hypothetical protein